MKGLNISKMPFLSIQIERKQKKDTAKYAFSLFIFNSFKAFTPNFFGVTTTTKDLACYGKILGSKFYHAFCLTGGLVCFHF